MTGSADYSSDSDDGGGGGGGVTRGELLVSLDDLMNDDVWQKNTFNAGIDYALSLWRIRPRGMSVFLSRLPTVYGVSGVTGAYVYCVPEWDTVLSGTFNQTNYTEKSFHFIFNVLMSLLMAKNKTISTYVGPSNT
eukprot:GFYU01054776.1.p1 GENE.GFYU01054776.1~~GFYU01054776.1.p1  ORF type:complete len:158 (-),score=50.53 GFYU01054776.1:33-437(-)